MLCEKCGTKNADEANYCKRCGHYLIDDVEHDEDLENEEETIKQDEQEDADEDTVEASKSEEVVDSASGENSTEDNGGNPDDKRARRRLIKVSILILIGICLFFVAVRLLIECFTKSGPFDFWMGGSFDFWIGVLALFVAWFIVRRVKDSERITHWENNFSKECRDYFSKHSRGIEIKPISCDNEELGIIKKVVTSYCERNSQEYDQGLFDDVVYTDPKSKRKYISETYSWFPSRVIADGCIRNPIRFILKCLLGKMIIESIPIYIYLIISMFFIKMLVVLKAQHLAIVHLLIPIFNAWAIWLIIFFCYQLFNLIVFKKLIIRLNYFRFLFELRQTRRTRSWRILVWERILKNLNSSSTVVGRDRSANSYEVKGSFYRLGAYVLSSYADVKRKGSSSEKIDAYFVLYHPRVDLPLGGVDAIPSNANSRLKAVWLDVATYDDSYNRIMDIMSFMGYQKVRVFVLANYCVAYDDKDDAKFKEIVELEVIIDGSIFMHDRWREWEYLTWKWAPFVLAWGHPGFFPTALSEEDGNINWRLGGHQNDSSGLGYDALVQGRNPQLEEKVKFSIICYLNHFVKGAFDDIDRSNNLYRDKKDFFKKEIKPYVRVEPKSECERVFV